MKTCIKIAKNNIINLLLYQNYDMIALSYKGLVERSWGPPGSEKFPSGGSLSTFLINIKITTMNMERLYL